MSEIREEFEKTQPVEGDIDEIDEDEAFEGEELDDEDDEEDFEDEMSEKSEDVCQKSRNFRKLFTRDGLARALIVFRHIFPWIAGVILFCLAFGELFEFYQGNTVGSISVFGLYGATFDTVFSAFGEITDSITLWYAVLQLLGAIVGVVAFLLAGGFSLLAVITSCRAFAREPDDPIANRMKVIFKFAFPNRVCFLLSTAAYMIPFLFPYYFAFVLERFYYMGIEPEPPIYVRSYPCIWVALGLWVATLALAIATARLERRKRMNMFLVEHKEEDDEKLSD